MMKYSYSINVFYEWTGHRPKTVVLPQIPNNTKNVNKFRWYLRQGKFICTAPFNNKAIQSALDNTLCIKEKLEGKKEEFELILLEFVIDMYKIRCLSHTLARYIGDITLGCIKTHVNYCREIKIVSFTHSWNQIPKTKSNYPSLSLKKKCVTLHLFLALSCHSFSYTL